MESELRELKVELNAKIDRILDMIKEKELSTSNDQDSGSETGAEKIPNEHALTGEQLIGFRSFYRTREEADKLENSMDKLMQIQSESEIDILKDSIEKLSVDLLEKRKSVEEQRIKLEMYFPHDKIGYAEKFCDMISKERIEDKDLENRYKEWYNNKEEEHNPVGSSSSESSSSSSSTPKRYSPTENEISTRKRRLSSESSVESDMGKATEVFPHPDCITKDPPTIRIFTSSSKKMAKTLDLLSNDQLISLLEIDRGHDFQVRQGYVYRMACKVENSSKIANSQFHALFVRYYNLEIISNGYQSFFTNFETSDNTPYLMFVADKNVKYTRDQLYLVNLRLIYPRTEKGRILNSVMCTKNNIYINALDNLVCIKTLRISP